jgi:hypothetical protein
MLIKIGVRRSHFGIFVCTALASPAWAATYCVTNPAPTPGQGSNDASVLRILDNQNCIAVRSGQAAIRFA